MFKQLRTKFSGPGFTQLLFQAPPSSLLDTMLIPQPADYPAAPTPPAARHEPDLDSFWQIDTMAILYPPADFCYDISLDTFFNASHSVVQEGRPGPVHTHSFRVMVTCRRRDLAPKNNTSIGYHTLREVIKEVVRPYNNTLLNDLPPFRELQPTTEVLSAVLFQQTQRALTNLLAELISVTVWESPTVSSTYRLRPRCCD